MSAPQLTASQRRELRARAHPLAPLVQVGRGGVTDAFVAELDRALVAHELVKIRLRGEREERAAQLADMMARLDCVIVGTVGAVAILYREADENENEDQAEERG
ncbi:MAG TPA: YhbY family RNA-binding protein [Thermoanaerobaculia bacterium]|jgi:putative YhbY family RNA-binding protein|nr:YhbY family RNA-binding protein [Thermoanaerobaculia bacterium]